MDNVIWIILASAVFIAMAGFLLFIGSGTLDDVASSATGFLERGDDPEDEIDLDSINQFKPSLSPSGLRTISQNSLSKNGVGQMYG